MVIRLIDLEDGRVISNINFEDLKVLKGCLEEEGPDDVDYYIEMETLSLLKNKGLNLEVFRVLEEILKTRSSINIGWEQIKEDAEYHLKGKLIWASNSYPATGLKIEAYDRDVISDDFLGWSFSHSNGEFEIFFSEKDFKDIRVIDIEGPPEIILKISDKDKKVLLKTPIRVMAEKTLDFGVILV
ncbi:MAG: transthyretin-like family protein [Candidatus Omnitrophica bacterium]|nr:transthyretin-like family protein [Candidatus Omnitrophota bacterium]